MYFTHTLMPLMAQGWRLSFLAPSGSLVSGSPTSVFFHSCCYISQEPFFQRNLDSLCSEPLQVLWSQEEGCGTGVHITPGHCQVFSSLSPSRLSMGSHQHLCWAPTCPSGAQGPRLLSMQVQRPGAYFGAGKLGDDWGKNEHKQPAAQKPSWPYR